MNANIFSNNLAIETNPISTHVIDSGLKILLIEDEAIIAEDTKIMLTNLGYTVLGQAASYEEAVDILSSKEPDLVLTDIAIEGDKDGIELAKYVRQTIDVPIIFLTSHSDRLTLERAKQVQPNGYLVKPFDEEDLFTSIEVAIANFSEGDSEDEDDSEPAESSSYLIKDSIYIKDNHLFVKVGIKDILWFKSEGNYIEIHTLDKRFVVRSSIKEFMDKLPANQFFRVHKSFAVNLNHVDAIDNVSVVVVGEIIPMGRNFRDALLKHLNTV